MIGDDSTTCDSPSAPISTGKVPSLAQPATASRARGRAGRAARRTRRRRRPAACARRRATGPCTASRPAPSDRASRCVFWTSTVSLTSARGARRPTPSPRGPRRRPRSRAAHRPTDDPAVRVRQRLGARRRRRGRGAPRAARRSPAGAAATASVELVLHRLVPGHPLHAVDGDHRRPARRTRRRCAASTARCWTCRQRMRTRTTGVAARVDHDLGAHGRALRARRPRRSAGGASTPNCQRSWFFRAEARYGYST